MINFLLEKRELGDLPPEIKELADNPQTFEKINKIIADFSIGKEKEAEIKNAVASVIKGDTNIYDIASLLEEKLGVDFDTALDMDSRLYQDLFSGIEDVLQAQYAVHQEGKVEKVKKEPVIAAKDVEKSQKEKSEFVPLIDKAVKKFNLFALPPSLDKEGRGAVERVGKERDEKLKKFYEIAETFLNSTRTKAQFKNTLVKPAADGGLGMEHQLADDVAEFLASYSRLQPVIAKSEEKKKISTSPNLSLSKERDEIISPPQMRRGEGEVDKAFASPRFVPPNVKIEVNFVEEEREAAAKKPKIEKMKTESPKLLSVTEGVTKALAELNYTFPSSELQERLKSVIDARVRNVRTSVQTFDKLTQDIPGGGMGFSKAEADKVSLVLNKYLEDKNKDIYGSKLAEIKKAEEEEKNKNAERARMAENAERKNFDARFTKLTGKTIPPLTPPLITRGEKEDKRIPLPPEEMPMVIPQRKEKAILPPSPSQPSLSKGGGSSPRPILEDIKYTPKLAGPTEEIARLTLEDFRKLSNDPKEAVLKIKDKLVLLREESYKKYQAGLDAWQKSPFYGEYLKAMTQSLTAGTPLHDILKGGQTLTETEFDAIISSRIGD